LLQAAGEDTQKPLKALHFLLFLQSPFRRTDLAFSPLARSSLGNYFVKEGYVGVITGILDVSRRSLNAQSLVIRTLSDNITNVNTPGYSRRTAELVTTQATGTGNLLTGTGVEVNRVTRAVDQFLNKEYLSRIADRSGEEVRNEYLSRAEQPFALEDSPGNIGHELTNFFASLGDLATSPADIALRTQLIQAGQTLTSSIRDAYNNTAALQREADNRIGELVTQVNTYTSQIAAINGQIVTAELGNQENLTLRDARDQLLRGLSELMPVQTLETSDGQIQVTLPNGFGLVNGNQANALTYTPSPDSGTFPVGLDGTALGHIVYDYAPSVAGGQVDFTSLIAAGSGEIGALLRVRGVQATTNTTPFQAQGDLVQVASRIETIARDLVFRFNQVYRGLAPPSTPTNPLPAGVYNGDENPATVAVFNPSSVDLNGAAPSIYSLFNIPGLTDVNGDGLENDLSTNLTALNRSNFASQLAFGPTDERTLALAVDTDLTAGTSATLAGAPGDGTIAKRLYDLRTELINYGAVYGVNTSLSTSTVEDLYRQTATYVGGLGSKSNSDLSAYKDREEQVKELQASTSGVSLDEEFAKLINFQRAFEAAGRMVRVGDEMFQTVLGLLG